MLHNGADDAGACRRTRYAETDLKDAIRSLALAHGARVFAVASTDEVDKRTPPGHRPEDYLAGARSVIVLGFTLYTAGSVRAADATAQSLSAHHGMKQVFATTALLAHAIERDTAIMPLISPACPLPATLTRTSASRLVPRLRGLESALSAA
jgi:hypothetical protein